MKVNKLVIIIFIIVIAWIGFLSFPYLFKNNSSIRDLTKEELLEKPITYNFKICDSCKTIDDVFLFEKQKKSMPISISRQDFKAIFNQSPSGHSNQFSIGNNDLLFLYDNPNTFIREITHYEFYNKNNLSDSLKLGAINMKYFYKDNVFNEIYPSSSLKPFSFKEIESVFYQLSQLYRKPLGGNSFYSKDYSEYYNISKGYYGESANYYNDKKYREPILYYKYSTGERKKHFYTTSKKIPYLKNIVEYIYYTQDPTEWNVNVLFNFSKYFIEKEPPQPSPLDYGAIYEDITSEDFAVFFKLNKDFIYE